MVRRDDDGSPAGDPDGNPSSVLRRYIPKADGKQRPLGIPTVRDRVVQAAARIVYLDFLDSAWSKRCADLGVLMHYCDDFVVLCKTEKDCREAERRVRKLLGELKLELHPDKTKRVDLSQLGQAVKELTPKSRSHEDPRAIIAQLNPVLRGWGQYFRTGNASDKFSEVDKYVVWRLRRMRVHRKGRHLKAGEARRWKESYFAALGLHHLHGTVAYPVTA